MIKIMKTYFNHQNREDMKTMNKKELKQNNGYKVEFPNGTAFFDRKSKALYMQTLRNINSIEL